MAGKPSTKDELKEGFNISLLPSLVEEVMGRTDPGSTDRELLNRNRSDALSIIILRGLKAGYPGKRVKG